jgi:hypothetical protein
MAIRRADRSPGCEQRTDDTPTNTLLTQLNDLVHAKTRRAYRPTDSVELIVNGASLGPQDKH